MSVESLGSRPEEHGDQLDIMGAEHDRSADIGMNEQRASMGSLESCPEECGGQSEVMDAKHDQATIIRAQRKTIEELRNHLNAVSGAESIIYEQRKIIEDHEALIRQLESRLEQVQTTHEDLRSSYENIRTVHLDQSEKLKLIGQSLSLEPQPNKNFENFSRLFAEAYIAFTAKTSSLTGGIQAVLELLGVLNDLRQVVNFPHIAGKKILAVAGGFSSGKSTFINSLIKNKNIELPTGLTPVTMVPSYVVHSDHACIKMHAPNGGNADLDNKLYDHISHREVEGFGFDLRKIIPFISVAAPLKGKFFQNICLVDTPGYNSGTDGSIVSGDKSFAAKIVSQASAMIWVIGLDSAGTISQKDIDFIMDADIMGDDLYIVLNKADDNTPQKNIDNIMEQVAEELEFAGIGHAGICAYSSEKNRKLQDYQDRGHMGKTLEEFFQSINTPSNVYEHFLRRIDNVFTRYNEALTRDKVQLEKRKNTLHKMRAFILEHHPDEYKKFRTDIDLNKEVKALDKVTRKAEDIHEKLNLALRKTLKSLGIATKAEEIRPAPTKARKFGIVDMFTKKAKAIREKLIALRNTLKNLGIATKAAADMFIKKVKAICEKLIALWKILKNLGIVTKIAMHMFIKKAKTICEKLIALRKP